MAAILNRILVDLGGGANPAYAPPPIKFGKNRMFKKKLNILLYVCWNMFYYEIMLQI